MSKIIISYRRADSDALAGRIRDRLAQHYGEGAVFMDIDNIPLGADFRRHIEGALLEIEILLAIIGPKWCGRTKGGRIRINDEADPVRTEVETALAQGIPIIPILASGATIPKPEDLPHTLKNLSFLNAVEIDAGRDFHQHMERLIRSMDLLLKSKSRSKPSWLRDKRLSAGLVGGLAILAAIGLTALLDQRVSREPVPQVTKLIQPSPEQPTHTKLVEQPALNIAGRWRDNWGITYNFEQEGDAFRFSAFGPSCRGNNFRTSGRGTISGRNVKSSYSSSLPSTGQCSGTVFANGTEMSSTCDDSICKLFSASLIKQ